MAVCGTRRSDIISDLPPATRYLRKGNSRFPIPLSYGLFTVIRLAHWREGWRAGTHVGGELARPPLGI
jgi:hypothetical protein